MVKVSVIVPVYNVEKYLCQCVDSIISQSFSDFQLILVDDGSTDCSPRICDDYAQKDSRIQVIHKRNGGLSDARNEGINAAKGAFITFIDSDDFLIPDTLKHLVHLAETYDAQIACCGYIRCENEETAAEIRLPDRKEEIHFYSSNGMEGYLTEKHIGTIACAKLYKTELFSNVRYPVGKYHEDVFTTYKLVHNAEKIVTSNFVGYIYRKNPSSITHVFSLKRFHGIEGKLEQMKFIEENYPELSQYAYRDVIYACNQCVIQMGKAGFYDREKIASLQKLYREYGNSYIKLTNSIKNRLFTVLAQVNVNLIIRLSRYI